MEFSGIKVAATVNEIRASSGFLSASESSPWMQWIQALFRPPLKREKISFALSVLSSTKYVEQSQTALRRMRGFAALFFRTFAAPALVTRIHETTPSPNAAPSSNVPTASAFSYAVTAFRNALRPYRCLRGFIAGRAGRAHGNRFSRICLALSTLPHSLYSSPAHCMFSSEDGS